MGQRISYYRNNFKKGLKEIIFNNFSAFKEWYIETDKSSMEEFDEPFGDETLIIYLKQNPDLKTDFPKLDKKLVDGLTSAFIGSYCDLTDRENKIFESFGPSINTRRYQESGEIVLRTNDEILIRLWNFIIKGRSLSDNGDFDSFTNDYKIGFLTFEEHRVLKAKIETHFGNIELIRQISGPCTETIGLECVLQALNEMTADNKELITAIE
jgi:hypothetical protein